MHRVDRHRMVRQGRDGLPVWQMLLWLPTRLVGRLFRDTADMACMACQMLGLMLSCVLHASKLISVITRHGPFGMSACQRWLQANGNQPLSIVAGVSA